MGFDVIGVKPKNDTGKDFRNNVWFWRPLWHLISNNTPDLSEEEKSNGHFNNGYTFDGKSHKAVIETLKRLLHDKPFDEVQKALSQSPYLMMGGRKIVVGELSFAFGMKHQFEWNNVEEFLSFCENNEGFTVS